MAMLRRQQNCEVAASSTSLCWQPDHLLGHRLGTVCQVGVRVVLSSPIMMALLWLELNILDILTTQVGLQMGALEANTIFSGLIASFGEGAAYALKLSVALMVALLLYSLGRTTVFKWANTLMAAVAASNITVLVFSFRG